MNSIDSLIKTFKNEVGYLEKNSNKNLDDKNLNAGDKNYTKYARDLYQDLQGQPWCDMFVDWCFAKTFGKDDAKKLLGGFSAYTPTSANYFKNKDKYFQDMYYKIGDIIFFKNSSRICHTGIIVDVGVNYIKTIEGNTSSDTGLVANGGCVAYKTYAKDYNKIDGYGRPDYNIVEPKMTGWKIDTNGLWYRHTYGIGKDTYYHDIVKEIKGSIYAFDSSGYLITDINKIKINNDGAIVV